MMIDDDGMMIMKVMMIFIVKMMDNDHDNDVGC